MTHTFTKIWVHLVFSTKNREPLIQPPLEPRLYNFIHEELLELGCPCRIINGMPDHVHILFLLNPVKSIAEIVKNLKGGSSHWVNQNNLARPKFSWQTGYAAFAVSESQMQKAYEYIANQKEHHQYQDFESEEKHLLELHGLKEE